MVPQEATMLLAQLLLMNHFLAGFSHLPADQPLFQDINGINSIEVDAGCPYGCVRCSALNGCLACKPPFYLLLRRDGARQTASCTRACPRGFYKVTKKRNGFCAKCTMRGCAECDRHHYCSRCAADFVNFFGKCIPSHPENALETPYPRKTIYSPPAILETSGTPPSARGTRPSHRTAGSSRTTSAPSAGPPRAPSAGPRRPPSSRTSSSAPPSSGPPSSPPALVNHSRPSPAVRVRPRRPQEKRPCRKKAAKKGKADKDGERRRNWKGRKKERQNKSKKGQKAKRKGCRKRMKGRRNGAKGNATLPRGEGSPGGSDVDSPPGATPEGTPTQGPPAEPSPSSEAPVSRGEQPRRGEHLAERSPPPDDPPDGARKSGLPPTAEGLRAPTLRGLRAERTRPHGGLAGHTGTAPGKGGGRATHAASAGHRWQGLDADTRRRARARPSASGGTPKLPSRHKRRHKHAPRRRILPATRAKARTHASSVQT